MSTYTDIRQSGFQNKGYYQENMILPRIGVILQNVKRLIRQENITIIIVYVPNNRASHCLKQKLMKLSSTLFKVIVRISRQKQIEELEDLNDTINRLDLIVIYRTLP